MRKNIMLLAIALLMACSVVFIPSDASAAPKHQKCSGAFLYCPCYTGVMNVPRCDASVYADPTHHYVGLVSIGSFYDVRVQLKYGKKTQTFTLKAMASEKKINKYFRGKKCRVQVYAMKYNKKARKWVKVKGTQAYFYKVKL